MSEDSLGYRHHCVDVTCHRAGTIICPATGMSVNVLLMTPIEDRICMRSTRLTNKTTPSKTKSNWQLHPSTPQIHVLPVHVQGCIDDSLIWRKTSSVQRRLAAFITSSKWYSHCSSKLVQLVFWDVTIFVIITINWHYEESTFLLPHGKPSTGFHRYIIDK